MSEIDDGELSDEQAREALKALKELRDSPGWAILTRVAQVQIQARTDAVMLSPRGDMKTEWDHEYKKGEVSGMRWLISLIDNEIENLAAVKEHEDDRNAYDTSPADDYTGGTSAADAERLARDASSAAGYDLSGSGILAG
jgi:hypothetical protein